MIDHFYDARATMQRMAANAGAVVGLSMGTGFTPSVGDDGDDDTPDPDQEVWDEEDRLLDEGVEETFPASDPVSVGRVD